MVDNTSGLGLAFLLMFIAIGVVVAIVLSSVGFFGYTFAKKIKGSEPSGTKNMELAERLRRQILLPSAGIEVFPKSETSANVIPITRQLGSAALSAPDATPEYKEASG